MSTGLVPGTPIWRLPPFGQVFIWMWNCGDWSGDMLVLKKAAGEEGFPPPYPVLIQEGEILRPGSIQP